MARGTKKRSGIGPRAGLDDLADVEAAAARRWLAAVNASVKFWVWQYVLARSLAEVRNALDSAVPAAAGAAGSRT